MAARRSRIPALVSSQILEVKLGLSLEGKDHVDTACADNDGSGAESF